MWDKIRDFEKKNIANYSLFNIIKFLTLTVSVFHFPDVADLAKFLKPCVTSPNSPGLGGRNSTLAYFQKVCNFGLPKAMVAKNTKKR